MSRRRDPAPVLRVVPLEPGRYTVFAGRGVVHRVKLEPGLGVRCDCLDFKYNGRVHDCKHLVAVTANQLGAEDQGAVPERAA